MPFLYRSIFPTLCAVSMLILLVSISSFFCSHYPFEVIDLASTLFPWLFGVLFNILYLWSTSFFRIFNTHVGSVVSITSTSSFVEISSLFFFLRGEGWGGGAGERFWPPIRYLISIKSRLLNRLVTVLDTVKVLLPWSWRRLLMGTSLNHEKHT